MMARMGQTEHRHTQGFNNRFCLAVLLVTSVVSFWGRVCEACCFVLRQETSISLSYINLQTFLTQISFTSFALISSPSLYFLPLPFKKSHPLKRFEYIYLTYHILLLLNHFPPNQVIYRPVILSTPCVFIVGETFLWDLRGSFCLTRTVSFLLSFPFENNLEVASQLNPTFKSAPLITAPPPPQE